MQKVICRRFDSEGQMQKDLYKKLDTKSEMQKFRAIVNLLISLIIIPVQLLPCLIVTFHGQPVIGLIYEEI